MLVPFKLYGNWTLDFLSSLNISIKVENYLLSIDILEKWQPEVRMMYCNLIIIELKQYTKLGLKHLS